VIPTPDSEYQVELLRASHNRAVFHSGAPDLDQYLRHQAGQDARRRIAAVFVLVDRNSVGESSAIVGYYTLSAYSVQLRELPEKIAQKLPRYPGLPATLLGRLAISSSHRGQNLGQFLLMDALHRSWRNTSEVASAGVVVEALDKTAHAFYLHHEFSQLQDHPNKLFIAMATIEKVFKAS
jgi:predicted GNAT family N-acyltransferase